MCQILLQDGSAQIRLFYCLQQTYGKQAKASGDALLVVFYIKEFPAVRDADKADVRMTIFAYIQRVVMYVFDFAQTAMQADALMFQ